MTQILSFGLCILSSLVLAHGFAPTSGRSFSSPQRQSHATAPVLVKGDLIGDIGTVESIGFFGVNSQRDWYASVVVRNLSGVGVHAVLLCNGEVVLRSGDPAPGAPHLTVSGLAPGILRSHPTFDRNGKMAVVLGIERPGEHGVLYGAHLVVHNRQTIEAPGVPPGTRYLRIIHVDTFRRNSLLVLTDLEDSVGAYKGRALIELELDERGRLSRERVIVKPGDVLPQNSQPVSRVDWGDGNRFGDVVFGVFYGGSHAIYFNDDLVAATGGASGIPGRNWVRFSASSRALALDDSGNYAYSGTLDGEVATNEVIVQNGIALRQKGDPVSPESPFAFTAFNTNARILVGNDGSTVFRAFWDDPDPLQDSGVFSSRNRIVWEGRRLGDTQARIVGVSSFELSPSGRYLLAEVVAVGGSRGGSSSTALLLIDRANNRNRRDVRR